MEVKQEKKMFPIGIVHSEIKERYEAPRQGVLSGNEISFIELNPNNNFEQALIGLEGFERIWVIFQFHLNTNWNPMVTPPRQSEKFGVFATRSPFRPNQIGLTCVKLEKIEGLKIYFSGSDILDGSPVFDIKPYLPFSDSFPEARTGWVKTDLKERYEIKVSPLAEIEADKIKNEYGARLLNYARVQLEFNPSDISRKRIQQNENSDENNLFILAYQKWNIFYKIDEANKTVEVTGIE